MPKKKGGAKSRSRSASPGKKRKGKKKGKRASFGCQMTFDYQVPLVSEMGIDPISYVSLTIKMVEMVHLSFDWDVVPTIVTIAGIKDSIKTRHGGTVIDIILYRDTISQKTLLPDDDALSLQDVGIKGSVYTGNSEELPHVTLWYDFPAMEVDCPILNDTPYEVESRFQRDHGSPSRGASPKKEGRAAQLKQANTKKFGSGKLSPESSHGGSISSHMKDPTESALGNLGSTGQATSYDIH